MKTLKISAKSARLLFNGCQLEYMRDVCHGRCCDAPTDPNGCKVIVTPAEAVSYKYEYRVKTVDNMLVGVNGKCPFKMDDHLCMIHNFGKPLGCTMSPFTVNSNDTIVIKNRNKLMRCYKAAPAIPAYKAYFNSLVAIVGLSNAIDIRNHLDKGGGDMTVEIQNLKYDIIKFVTEGRRK